MRVKRLPRTDHGLAELANRQFGVVSIRQLTGPLGYSQSAVDRALRSGRLHRVHQGVYAVGYSNLSLHGECLAAVLGCGPNALLSHWSAAWLWGIFKGSPVPIHVTGPIPRRLRPTVRIHHSRVLASADRGLEVGIPVTSVARTYLDLAAHSRPDRLRSYLERGEELGLLDFGSISELLDRTRGHHGWGRLRRAARIYGPRPFTRSEFERLFYEAVASAGLPTPRVNYFVEGFELDVYWPEHRFAVELDTYGTHGTREAFARDRFRGEELLLAGITMTRVTDERFAREPREVIRRLRRLLTERE